MYWGEFPVKYVGKQTQGKSKSEFGSLSVKLRNIPVETFKITHITCT